MQIVCPATTTPALVPQVVQYIASKNLTYVVRASGGTLCQTWGQLFVVIIVLPFLQIQHLREAKHLAAFGILTIFVTIALYFTQVSGTAPAPPPDSY